MQFWPLSPLNRFSESVLHTLQSSNGELIDLPRNESWQEQKKLIFVSEGNFKLKGRVEELQHEVDFRNESLDGFQICGVKCEYNSYKLSRELAPGFETSRKESFPRSNPSRKKSHQLAKAYH